MLAKKTLSPLGGHTCALKVIVNSKELKGLERIHSEFWKRVLKTVATLSQTRDMGEVQTQSLWNNHKIRYKGNPLHLSKTANFGINYLQDLWVNGTIRSREQIEQITGSYAGLIFHYNAVTNAFPKEWKTQMETNPVQTQRIPLNDITTH